MSGVPMLRPELTTADQVLRVHTDALGADLTYRHSESPLVECFRRADWIDVSLGVRAFGIRRAFVRSLYEAWPNAGFHALLARLSLARLLSHPWSPLPMVKL
jgi:hypothetical protein